MEYLIKSLALLFVLAGCGVNMPVTISEPAAPPPPGGGEVLKGAVEMLDGSVVNLEDLSDKPLVLVFAQDTCVTCYHEAMDFKKALGGKVPTNIHILHVLVGAKKVDAEDWKDGLGIPWAVGFEKKAELKTRLCGTGPVPCTIVQTPDKGIEEPHIGEATAKEIMEITGEWETE